MVKSIRGAGLVAALTFLLAAPASAQSGIGGQVSYSDELRAGFGARAAFILGPMLGQEPGTALAALHGMLAVDHFPDPGLTEAHANLLLPVLRLGRAGVYVGGGAYTGWNGDSAGTGLNALAGATLRVPFTTLFAEGRFRFGDAADPVFSLGFLLGRG